MEKIAMNAHFWEGFYGMEALEGYQAVYLTPDFNEPVFKETIKRIIESFEEPNDAKEPFEKKIEEPIPIKYKR